MLHLPQNKRRKRGEKSVLWNAIWNPWPHSSFCTIQKPKEKEQKAPTKAPAKNIFSWCCNGLLLFTIVTDTALESCAEKQEQHIWACITSGFVLCFPFWVTIKLKAQCTWTNFPLPNNGNERKPILPHFLHAENKRKRSPAQEQASQKGTVVSKASVCFQIQASENRILFCDVDKSLVRYIPFTGTALRCKVWL